MRRNYKVAQEEVARHYAHWEELEAVKAAYYEFYSRNLEVGNVV